MPNCSNHLAIAHTYWKNLLAPGDFAIDATCGNGHDTLVLAKLCLTASSGSILALDIQNQALENTSFLLHQNLPPSLLSKITLLLLPHENLDSIFLPFSSTFPSINFSSIKFPLPKLIVYNLGYLPGSDKTLTTQTTSTLLSLEKSLSLIAKNDSQSGAVSITCYPGHEEGKKEEKALLQKLSSLDKKNWTVCFHSWPNRPKNPSLLWITKN